MVPILSSSHYGPSAINILLCGQHYHPFTIMWALSIIYYDREYYERGTMTHLLWWHVLSICYYDRAYYEVGYYDQTTMMGSTMVKNAYYDDYYYAIIASIFYYELLLLW